MNVVSEGGEYYIMISKIIKEEILEVVLYINKKINKIKFHVEFLERKRGEASSLQDKEKGTRDRTGQSPSPEIHPFFQTQLSGVEGKHCLPGDLDSTYLIII